MGWRYRARLFLIAAVVIIWVTSAEVTQGIFTDYKQPFAVTYLGVSLMVVYLPIAFIKDWICSIIRKCSCNNESSARFSSPLNCIAGRNIFEIELEGNLNKKDSEADLSALEEGKPLVPKHIDDANVNNCCVLVSSRYLFSQVAFKSREDHRKQLELEEARKAGLAPVEVDEDGKEINPHIPQYMSSAPWYLNTERPSLKHQRKWKSDPNYTKSWYDRGAKIYQAEKFMKVPRFKLWRFYPALWMRTLPWEGKKRYWWDGDSVAGVSCG
ncbi:Pre-mRNA-splicing factor SLU7-A [Camellia lanceoleosa]|uniref:Pre-mRNA-splicing factor SLU7-A n=1 Tax=Camellia lanceoleosa TaxID=1840588 RepID=A0ACC0G8J8_9ERIC|nr:Pre-mRNA-splicing factor SLU7-A [Camellia lanceoleosa]